MKNYYEILGIQESANDDEIKKAFRRLAFQHHPDKNPGNEARASEKFKEINEAYSVLGDESRKLKYDDYRKGGFGNSRQYDQTRTYYSNDSFFDPAMAQQIFTDMERMFSQMGLRFDKNFFDQMFSEKSSWSGTSSFSYSYRGPGGIRRDYKRSVGNTTSNASLPHNTGNQLTLRKPNYVERMITKVIGKLGKYAIRKSFGIDLDLPPRGNDIHRELKISPKEAEQGCTKRIRYKRGKEKKIIEVDIPDGISSGKKIKLSEMGEPGLQPGDLYLRIKY